MASEEAQTVENRVVLPQYKYSKRVLLKTIVGRSDEGLGLIGERVVVGGWVKSSKEQTKEVQPTPTMTTVMTGHKDVTCVELFQSRIPLFRAIIKVLGGTNSSPLREKLEKSNAKPVPSIAYLQVSDGSCVPSLQVVLDSTTAPLSRFTHTGTSILVEGVLQQSSIPGKRVIELKVEKILHVGTVEHEKYPLSKTRLPLDVLRGYSHLRPRTTTVASVTRIRNALTHGTNTFFQSHGFLNVHMPVITSIDSKGFSDKFQVTTLLGKADKKEEANAVEDTGAINLEVVKAAIKEKSNRIEELKRSESNRESLALAVQDLKKANELASQLEAQGKTHLGTLSQAGKLDFSRDFFPRQMYLTVSSQLHLESYASALGSVYTIGPTFSAEKSQSLKHLAEMWMVEVEIAFADLEDVMNCAEDYLKFLCQWVLENCSDDLKFASKRIDKTTIDHLQSVASSSFEKITYTEAVELLQKVTDKSFERKAEWGIALTDEHESYLADEMYKRPVIISNYPKELKPFFVRQNDDGKTVATIDVVVPKAGTLIRGSQKEERINIISRRIKELGLPKEKFEWYLDLRRHGTVKHSGFSLGFDHMVLFSTGLTDVKDIIPFPRSCGYANC
ncbi:Aspartyl/Asparaginyl-tRNA synthetase [Macleaya cordata]|uniref:asparagine--tRNA ligase n=1 Tax=Macleaya cordata TaxID=56857 RepID=A0A200QE49_MACCD|nr:Aspartyl/Asparaginyl-tRNA synthetase [Macleaya cordata]